MRLHGDEHMSKAGAQAVLHVYTQIDLCLIKHHDHTATVIYVGGNRGPLHHANDTQNGLS